MHSFIVLRRIWQFDSLEMAPISRGNSGAKLASVTSLQHKDGHTPHTRARKAATKEHHWGRRMETKILIFIPH